MSDTTEPRLPELSDELTAAQHHLVEERLVIWYFVAALGYLFVSMSGGLVMALQLVSWNPLQGSEYLSPGRWRMVHTNAIAYGFIANCFLGALHWSVPRLTLKPVLSRALSYFIFVAWQVVVLSTAVGIVMGEAQGIEWGETPKWIDPLALAGLALVAINFMHPIAKTKGPLYVTLWYFMAAFVWTFLTYAMGNFLPEYLVAGTSGGAIAGLFIHDLVGLFVTPLAWGLMYYFVPILLKKPIWSHGLSLVGFWGLAFFYPLAGDPPLPAHPDSDVPAVWGGDLHHRRGVGGHHGGDQLLRHDLGFGPGGDHQPADSLVLYRHGDVLHHLCAVCSAGDDHFSEADSLHRLGGRTRPSGDVRRL